METDKAKSFLEDVFPAELEQIVSRRNVSLPRDRGSLGAAVQAFRTARDLKTAIDTARSQGTILLRLKAKVLSPVENLSQRIPFPKLQCKFESVARAREIDAEVNRHEQALEGLKQDSQLAKKTKPSTGFDLVGLAFSGGGIRSATFNLGILQSLADLGILKCFDYLSTVSGGGYIGSWFTAWILREAKYRNGGTTAVERQLKPAYQSEQANAQNPQEPRSILHLRRYSNYLTPRLGLFSQDTWTGIAIYVRNLVLNQLILVPALATIMVIPRITGKLFDKHSEILLWLAISLTTIALVSITFALSRLRQARASHFQLRDLQSWICVPLMVASLTFIWFLFGSPASGDLEPTPKWLLDYLPGYNLLAQSIRQVFGQSFESCFAWFLLFATIPAAISGVFYLVCTINKKTETCCWQWIFSAFVSGGVAGILFYSLVHFARESWTKAPWDAATWGPPLGLVVFLLAITVQVGIRGITEPDEWREWRASMGAWLLIYALGWTGIFAISFYGPLGWYLLLGWTKTKATVIIGWVISTAAAVLAGKSSKTDGSAGPSWFQWIITICPGVAVLGLLIAVALASHTIVYKWSVDDPKTKKPPETQKIVKGTLTGITKVTASISLDVDLKLEETSDTKEAVITQYWRQVDLAHERKLILFLALCGLIAVGMAITVDINEFSLHAAYRNRLVRSYLGASREKAKVDKSQPLASNFQGDIRTPDPIIDFDPNDDFNLSEFYTSHHYDGPYPLINTTLNLTAGVELAWQERKASSFVLSPLFCGSQDTAFRETDRFGGGIKLGTALAISGAAASPNMGYHTSAPMAFLLTLFNVRLGWWVGNPRKGRWIDRGPRGSLFYLLTELFGQTDSNSWYIYLSDGGHFENLGIYELVRRRCKYIVCCDAGADPQIGFEDLGKAIRQIRTDQGVDIEIDLDMVRPKADQRYSRWHHAIGVIRYDQADSNETVGMLVYIKASITGDESGDVLEYAGHNASFPHQSTADQFFDESQFESYRKLGEHVAWEVFRCAQAEAQNGAAAIFNVLRHYWVSLPPRLQDSFLGQQDALVRLEAKLRDDPELAGYDLQIYPEIESLLGAGTSSWPALDPRAALHFCNMQIDLMENVFLALELQKYHSYALNRGWMNLFRRWATTSIFQKLWPGLRGGYSRQFSEFVEEHLLPGTMFQIVNQIPLALVPRLLDAFDRDQLSKEIAPQFPALLNSPLSFDSGSLATWSAVPDGDPPFTEAWGVAVVTKEGSASYDHQLFVWVRGAYRNLGLGGKLLDEALLGLRNAGLRGKLLVDLGEEKPGNPGHQQRKAAWLRLYGQRGFIREFDRTRLRLTLQL